jgi:hypothetical protein
VGRILEEYDTNKTYPVYGFGAKVSVAFGVCIAIRARSGSRSKLLV